MADSQSSKSASTDLVVLQLDTARQALAQAKTIQQTKKILDVAAAAEIYAKRQQMGQEAIDYASSVKLEALRQLGQLIATQKATVGLNRGTAGTMRGRDASGGAVLEPPEDPRPTLADVGVTKKVSALAQKIADLPAEQFAAVVENKTSIARAVRDMHHARDLSAREKAEAELSARQRQSMDAVCDLRVCSCAELFASGIRPDAVITDPPYPREFLPSFTELAVSCQAAGVSLVAVMSGQSYLPDVVARLCAHLTYRWTLAYLTPGGQAVQQWEAKINASWKPVLLFGEATDWIGDVAKSKVNDNDKRFHEWGQSESGMVDLVERLTKPGQLICDPFLGGGSTAVAALACARRFVGCDTDTEAVARTRKRIEAMPWAS